MNLFIITLFSKYTLYSELSFYLSGTALADKAMVNLSVVQSFTRILIHNALLFINTSTMLGITKVIG